MAWAFTRKSCLAVSQSFGPAFGGKFVLKTRWDASLFAQVDMQRMSVQQPTTSCRKR